MVSNLNISYQYILVFAYHLQTGRNLHRREQDTKIKRRCKCKLAKSLPADQRPQCYPYWEEDDPSFPMPFDLTKTLSELEHLIKEMD
uniref:Alpha-ketoglutarate-dependent dioxygenase FTO C-terminal domain-containing protein n=1 Tax=Pyxicephalus adspersus TaxID=30357 RepID=A0AAV2ZYJ8_PYXAD|nr:TPA: hypothetical protein GDO54_002568 [Pyxicephalus adspersus]